MITIGNKRTSVPLSSNWIQISGDRTSALGNPFSLTSESFRNEVCEGFDDYFEAVVNLGLEPITAAKAIAVKRDLIITLAWIKPSRAEFMTALDHICDLYEQDEDIILMCWCVPKRCHLETVFKYVKVRFI